MSNMTEDAGIRAALENARQIADGSYAVISFYPDGTNRLWPETLRDKAFRQQGSASPLDRNLVIARFGSKRVAYAGRDTILAVVND